ncbi:acetyltransferase [Mesorhizobium sp. RP14(2022)]|uniref:Acetyltransferase n=1 Tax=Mesorhizobium liriopis TaxID=2953882 RepID=A0ABT1C299_9HYPH|nr:GNAT family N-acetyltransferase [Mesorhizobium liriopis]MCO6048892.1 acetyltransferase [Mesorhizobium liriopis]
MPRYGIRPLERSDLSLLARWLEQPHWKAWWGEPADELAQIEDHIDSVSVEPLILELDGKPVGYAQVYDPHLEDDHPYADQPYGTLGIDLSVGEESLTGTGHGSAFLRQLTEELFDEGAPRVVIDPHPDNLRAISAYAKAGFQPLDRRESVYGPALLMFIDNPDFEGETP